MTDLTAFATRLRPVAISLDTLDVEALRRAVRPTGAKVKLPLIIDMVRLAHRRPIDARRTAAFLRSINGRKDKPLVAAEQAELVSVLASAALIESFTEASKTIGIISAALAVRTCVQSGWQPVHPELRHAANSFLARSAHESRLPPKPPVGEIIVHPYENVVSVQPSAQDPSRNVLLLASKSVGEQMEANRNALATMASSLWALQDWAVRREDILLEQLDFAWWLLDAPAEIKGAELAFATAERVMPLVRFSLAPPSLPQLLRRRLGKTYDAPAERTGAEDVALGAELQATPDELVDLCPLSGLARRSGEVSVTTELSVGELINGIVDEQLLISAIRRGGLDGE